MKLRSHLLVLTLGTLLPVVALGVVAAAFVADREREIIERGARQRTLALLTAVDTELAAQATSLSGLAVSRSLEEGRIAAFHEEAVRAVRVHPSWVAVRLARADGVRILDSAVPWGEPLPQDLERTSFDAVLRTRRPTISNLTLDGGFYHYRVRIPVEIGGELTHVLSVLIEPRAIRSLLARQRLPEDWVGVVLDGNRRIVARTIDDESTVGHLASESLRAALDAGDEGWFRGTTIEGLEVYTPFTRSPYSGWTVAMGIPAEQVEAGALRLAWLVAFGVVAAIALASGLAVALGRRISRPIGGLAQMARELGTGGPIATPPPGDVEEVHDVAAALDDAARAVHEREEALRAADQAKDEFLAMLGHELRNPLSALLSAAQLLEISGPREGPSSVAPGIVTRQVRHMTRLVDDLLDVSRVTTGKVGLTRHPLDLGELVATTLRAWREDGRFDDHHVRVETEPVWVRADAARLEQVVANLVGNAVKYTPPGGRIEVVVSGRDDEAVLEVADTGAGLPPDLLPRVFDLFVQGERSLDRSLGGLGIGLTLVRRLVELHGGEVAAESAGAGRGSRFVVRLPAIEAPEGAANDDGHEAPGERAG